MKVMQFDRKNEETAVTLFDKKDYRGEKVEFTEGKHDCKALSIFSKRTESLIVNPGYAVVVYEGCFEGKFTTYEGPVKVRKTDLQNSIQSMEVRRMLPTAVTLFDKVNYGGEQQKFKDGDYTCQTMGKMIDRAQSLVVEPGYYVIAYQHCLGMKDFEGKTFIYNGPVKVSKTQLQNEISSLRVVKSVYGEKYLGCYAENSKDTDLGTLLVK